MGGWERERDCPNPNARNSRAQIAPNLVVYLARKRPRPQTMSRTWELVAASAARTPDVMGSYQETQNEERISIFGATGSWNARPLPAPPHEGTRLMVRRRYCVTGVYSRSQIFVGREAKGLKACNLPWHVMGTSITRNLTKPAPSVLPALLPQHRAARRRLLRQR
jgi:hypothetical protein